MIQGHSNLDFSLVGVVPKPVPFTRRYNVVGKEIRVVAGDRGGFAALAPPLLKALDSGCGVHVYFTGACRDLMAAGELIPDLRMEVSGGLSDLASMQRFLTGKYDLLVAGASQSREGTEAAFNAIMAARSRILAVQDLYGSFMPTLAMLREARGLGKLGCVCVTDEFAKAQIMGKFNLKHCLIVTGGPQFDKAVEIKKTWGERRRTLREALGVSDKQPVFLIVGGKNGTAEILHLLEKAIEIAGLAEAARVILRVHSRATDEDKRQTAEYFNSTKRKWFAEVDKSLAPTSDDILPGVDFVLSGFSTTNYLAILYGIVGTVYVGTPAFQKDLMEEKGLRRSPEVEIGAGWYVQDEAELAKVIREVRMDKIYPQAVLDLAMKQMKVAGSHDGKAAERVWQEMQKLMGT